jgi:hypothetical protein
MARTRNPKPAPPARSQKRNKRRRDAAYQRAAKQSLISASLSVWSEAFARW